MSNLGFPADLLGLNLPVKGFIEASLLDFPLGKPGSVLFLSGCDLRCIYCQAAHLVEGFDEIPTIPLPEILETIVELNGFVQGITFTGGEVSLHRDLYRLLEFVKNLGLKTRIDTYGANPPLLDSWIRAGLIDALAVDIKGPWGRYPILTGRPLPNQKLDRLKTWIQGFLRDNSISIEFRTTVHPEVLSPEEILETAGQIAGAKVYVIQNYKPVPGFNDSLQYHEGYSTETLREIASDIRRRKVVHSCFVRGFERDDPFWDAMKCES